MTSRTAPAPSSSPSSRLRRDRLLVGLAAVVWLAGTYVGSGVAGEGVSQQARGLFSDHATLIAPHGPAFSIWSVIYLGLAGYVVWQFLPASRESAWARATRLPAAASLALNGAWLLVVQAGLVWLSVLVMLGIAGSLGVLLRRVALLEPSGGDPAGPVAIAVVPVTFGLYLGWICVATCANIASFLVDLGVPVATTAATATTVVVLAVVVLLAVWLARRIALRPAVVALAVAIVWGTAWVAVGRFVGLLRSDVVAWAALAAAVLVAVLGLTRLRGSSRR